MVKREFVVGIDLGTTNSCVSIWEHGGVTIIPNELEKNITPSCVSFDQYRRLIGEEANNQAAMNPENTIYCAKRFIGRHIDDDELQSEMKTVPFKVSSIHGKPVFEVNYKSEPKLFTAEEISSMILSNLKETAENYLGYKVEGAVITVPAYFNDSQRQATRDAGKIAGINVIQIINEPTAAAIAYGIQNPDIKAGNILVYDLGGGTFDVTILRIDCEEFKVLATGGNTKLGGEDVDNLLVNYFVNEFKKKHGYEIKDNYRALRRLKSACERAKIALSASKIQIIDIDSLYNGIDFCSTLTEKHLSSICADLFKSTLVSLESVLLDSGLKKDQIDKVILVGGSTRIPKIQEMVSNFFNGKNLDKTINPDEAVAQGAAIKASMLSGNFNSEGRDLILLDVNSLSLGIEVIGGIMSNVIKRNNIIPCEISSIYETVKDDQTKIRFRVYEGERMFISDNYLLNEFLLEGIKPLPRGQAKVKITFSLDENGILKVTALDLQSNFSKSVIISNPKGRLSNCEIEKMITEAKSVKEEEKIAVKKIKKRNELGFKLIDVKRHKKTSDKYKKLSESFKKYVETLISVVDAFLITSEENEYEVLKKSDDLDYVLSIII
ncbi:Heat shock 70 kDa protein 1 [Smittium mucronatum]|uniref:Heat shock 70 kDa protein 1 n=1 Tax=Smittium mucronatum TaxID=133383 RepID=A0A1R0GYF4_9FUNG|nr:Heat shock 70 kDa protein 1 [Smittium mucronatum]